jgi:hypothetical protein
MATPNVRPTFIHLGPLQMRRRHFIGVREKEGEVEVMIGADGYGIYSQYLREEKDIDEFWNDFHRHKDEGRL